MNILQEISAWAKKLPTWQSDAVRRLFLQDRLSSIDERELEKLLFAAYGLLPADEKPPVPVPFSDVVKASTITTRKVILKELHSVDNVNALVAGQSILFAQNGMTVIYGENGAGKSGYARVFKHACHAREKGEPVLTNVARPSKNKPTAVVELAVNGEDIAVRWKAGAASSDILSEIAVFDSHCARVFVDEANEVVYLPYGLDVFGKLAGLCKTLKDRITLVAREIPQQLLIAGDFSERTIAGRFVRTLSDKSDRAQIAILGTLDEKQTARLEQLGTLVGSAKANPPKQRAAQLRRTKERFENLQTKLKGIATAQSDDATVALKALRHAAMVAAQASQLASTEAFKDDPLATTGSDPWRLLFDAAKTFSEVSAYPGEPFPVVDQDAVCVLCQQSLSPTAAERLSRFAQYVLQNAAKRKVEADAALASAITVLNSLDLHLLDNDKPLADELHAYSESLSTLVGEVFTAARARRAALLDPATKGNWDSLPMPSVDVDTQLKAAVTALEASAQEFDKADKPEELKRLTDELLELQDRARLLRHAKDVETFIEQKSREAKLKRCEKALDTAAITRTGSEMMERAVTRQLMECLKTEIDFFSVQCVPVQVRKLGEKGKTKHQLTILSDARPSGVLSEGEQRVVAISSFLAELATGASTSPIIFDDPVSSLDHLFRDKVAARLVREAKTRQVVIFTHDIVMLLAIERECAEQGVARLVHTVRRTAAGPGECPQTPSRPWHACNTGDRIGFLKNASAQFKKVSVASPDAYVAAGKECYGKLRETWERAIEEHVLQDVIQRFRPSVETQRLSKVVIDPADYTAIERGMKKCSTWLRGHDSAAAINAAFPTPEEIANDIQELEEFVQVLIKRAEKAGATARASLKPPAPIVAKQRAKTIIEVASGAALT